METTEIDAILQTASLAQHDWAAVGFNGRAAVLLNAATRLHESRHHLALLITREMGKPIHEALAEIEKCCGVLKYYAENSESFLADEDCSTAERASWVSYEPMGVVLAIMPWNFPFWQVFRFAAPALMAGNAVLLKHSPNTTGCALEAQEILAKAGLNTGLFTSLVIDEADVPSVTRQLVADDRVAAVTLTGSEGAGSAVGAIAGHEIKKCILELGGSDPFVVLSDAEIRSVAAHAVAARFLNGGQSCISPKRFIVEQSVVDEFTDHLVEAVSNLNVGDPEHPDTDIGPLARPDLRDLVAWQVESSVAAGAVLLTGGTQSEDNPGNYYPPTVLTKVRAGTPAYDDEIFGPVAAIISVQDADEAVAVANDTRFGLGASVWGKDIGNATSVGRRITAGACFINEIVTSDPCLPFGGTKRSGYGRELSLAGIREFANTRSWRVASRPATKYRAVLSTARY